MSTAGLRVAFDMDGTVADMHSVLRREAERLFGPGISVNGGTASPTPQEVAADTGVPQVVAADLRSLTREQLRALWDHVQGIENFWTTLPEMEDGIVARIAATALARRWDVLFITTRPQTAGEPTQRQTQRWLHAHGFEFPSVCVLERSRGRLASVLQLNAVVDDRPENCLDVAADSKARALLIWPGSPVTMPAGLERVGVKPMTSIGEAVTWLEAFDDRRKQSPVIRSVRRLLGRE
jgi:phosphoglycolate phosphatase-like HAD superfamily hydrolase